MKLRDDMTVILDDYMGDQDKIVRAAKISTKGSDVQNLQNTDPGRFIRWLIREGHGSPFEHVVFSFYLEVPIFVSRQIVKYRHSSINEHSGRYSEFQMEAWVPEPSRKLQQVGKTGDYEFTDLDGELVEAGMDILKEHYHHAEKAYDLLLKNGWAKEAARAVIPTGAYSRMYVTMNLRSWLHFCAQRATEAPSHGQHEIAQVADRILEVLEEHVPDVVAQFKEGGYVSI